MGMHSLRNLRSFAAVFAAALAALAGSAAPALAQISGGWIGGQVQSPFKLQIDGPVGLGTLKPIDPPPLISKENSPLILSFRLTVGVPSLPVPVPSNIRVCTPDMQSCAHLTNVGVAQQLSGLVSMHYPEVGEPTRLVVCEDHIGSLGPIVGEPCNNILAEDQKDYLVTAVFTFFITDVNVLHTRARTTDDVSFATMAGTDFGMLDKPRCSSAHPDEHCQFGFFGSFQDGHHPIKKLAGAVDVAVKADDEVRVAIATANQGGATFNLPEDLFDDLQSAATPVLMSIPSEQFVDVNAALNDHLWAGCDGPTASAVFHMPVARLVQLTQATGSSLFPLPVNVVRSEIGCGASSQYQLTLEVFRNTWHR